MEGQQCNYGIEIKHLKHKVRFCQRHTNLKMGEKKEYFYVYP
jgi:hypothetical protein